jgi:hypothetical protein
MAGAYEPEFFEEAGVPIDDAADEALKWAIIGCQMARLDIYFLARSSRLG